MMASPKYITSSSGSQGKICSSGKVQRPSLHFIPFIHYHRFQDQSQHITSLPARHLHHFNMKTQSLILSVLAGIATASPLALEVRQSTNVGITANEFTRGGCKDVIFFFARGSTEIGNMVSCSRV